MYHERRTFTWAWLLLLIALAGVVAAAISAASEWDDKSEGRVFSFIMAGTALFMGGMGIAFFKYGVEVSSGQLKFGYSFWAAETPVDEIQSAAAEKLTFGNWMGQGWRIDTRKRIGYISSFGPGVEIILRSGRTYVMSCRNPAELLSAIGFADDQPGQQPGHSTDV